MSTMVMYDKGSRDPRLITVRRGGTLEDADHRLLAVWAAACAEHVLHFFEQAHPGDERPRRAIEQARAWARGEITMTQARTRPLPHTLRPERRPGPPRKRLARPVTQWRWPIWRTTSSARRRMPSGPSVQRRIQTIATTWAVRSAGGSARSFLTRSATLCSTMSGSATRSAGPSSTADAPPAHGAVG